MSNTQQGAAHYQLVAFKDLPGWESASFCDKIFLEALSCSTTFFEEGACTKRRGVWHSKRIATAYQEAFRLLVQENPAAPTSLTAESTFKNALQKAFHVYKVGESPRNKRAHFTGYYHPVLQASKKQTERFRIPLYKRPPSLIVIEDLGCFLPDLAGIRFAGTISGQTLRPFFTRRDINQGALEGQCLEIGWIENPLEAFLMMVQGSGTLEYTDGTTKTFHYDGTNGHSYTSIGKALIARGVMTQENSSLVRIRSWCEANTATDIQALLEKNDSYVFFKESGTVLGPEGALECPLVPHHSLAVDPRYIPMGAPVWVDIPQKYEEGFSHKGIGFAQDIGGAIKGPARADLYCGPGQESEKQAGSLSHEGNLYLFLPKTLKPQDLHHDT